MKSLESLFWGAIAALGALVLELVLASILISPAADMRPAILGATSLSWIVLAAAAIEESFKYLIISRRIAVSCTGRSCIINSLLCGLGFGALELTLFFSGNLSFGATSFQIWSLPLLHMLTSAYIGYRIIVKKSRSFVVILTIIAPATLIHAAFNIFIREQSYQAFAAAFLLFLAAWITWVFFRIKRVLAH